MPIGTGAPRPAAIMGCVHERVVYRVTTTIIATTVGVLGVGGAVLLLRMGADDAGPVVLTWVGVGWVVFSALLLALTVRSATVVTDAGVEVRGAFRTRTYPWERIAHVMIEEIGGPASAVAIYSGVIYDENLRRVALPYVNHKRLGEGLEGEVRKLYERWEDLRGPNWEPRTLEVAERIDVRRNRDRVWQHAIVAALAGFVLAIVVTVVVLIVAAGTPFVHTDLFGMMPLLVPVLPVVSFAVVATVGLLRRRARLRSRW